jgi:hypothetical protein
MTAMSVTTDDPAVAATEETLSVSTKPVLLDRTIVIFAVLLAFGIVLLAFTWLTVQNHSAAEIDSYYFGWRTHVRIGYWLDHGYFSTGGLLVYPVPLSPARPIYVSSTGALLISGFLLEKLCVAVTGHPNWRLLALHNQFVSLLAATLLALLAYRLARRSGTPPLHALLLAVALQSVYFTFPDNLMIFWEITSRAFWLIFVCIFLLIDEHRRDGAITRSDTLFLAASVFFMTWMEYIAGACFIGSYVLLNIVLVPADRRWSWKRLLAVCVLPMLFAIGVHRVQIAVARHLHPEMDIHGTTFMSRTGLDGAIDIYQDHLDIAYNRKWGRNVLGTEKTRDLLLKWPWLFYASTAALVTLLIGAMWRRVPRSAILALFSMIGTYIVYGAVFSQALVIHPYLYDVMIFTPLMLALFVLLPSMLEVMTREKGLLVAVSIFLAIWVSMVQMRRYAVTFANIPKDSKVR